MKVIREFKGVELARVSRDTGFSIDWLEKVEAGEHDPSLDQAEVLARALGVHRVSITGPIFDCNVFECDENWDEGAGR